MFRPKFTITSKILSMLTEIAELKVIVDRARVLPQREALLRQQATVQIAHHSTSIEGNMLNTHEVEKVLRGEQVLAPRDAIKEVKNYKDALNLVDQLSHTKHALSIDNILKIHKALMIDILPKEKVGKLRPGPVFVANVIKNKEEILYTAPVASAVKKHLADLIVWVRKSEIEVLHPIITAGLLHYQFVTIHPFSDGNGRATRLITSLHLYQHGYAFRKLLVLDQYYNEDKKRYVDMLNTGKNFESRKGVDLTSWIEYFIEGFLVEAHAVGDVVKRIDAAENAGVPLVSLDKDEIRIMDFLATVGHITSEDVAEILGVAKRTSQEKIKQMVQKHVLQLHGKGPSTFYTLPNNRSRSTS